MITWNGQQKIITAHPKPTASEIRFGHGCTHYRDFFITDWLKPDFTIK